MNWYYAEREKQAGPVTEEQLVQLFQSGKINHDTLVWHEGMADWLPYGQATAPPGQPPVLTVPGAPKANEGEVVCAECGKSFPTGETVRIGKASVCAACKPVFLQKLSEGAPIHTGGLEYAGIPIRFAASFLDGLLLGAFNLATNFVCDMIFGFAMARGPIPHSGFYWAMQLILMAVNMSVALTYETVMIGKFGATLGKMACKIKVVTSDGGKVSYPRAAARYFAKLLSAFTCMIGYLMALFDSQNRALHDRICDTRVVMK
jgi:uncharacterized RDD family membrane protein YckC